MQTISKANTTGLTNDQYRELKERGDAQELYERQKGMNLQTFFNGKPPKDYSYQTCVDTIRGSRYLSGKKLIYHNEELFAIFRQIVDERLSRK